MKKIFWHQGLFLQPQHFQILESNIDEALKIFKDFAVYFWGVRKVEFNNEAILNNELQLDDFEVVLKDASIVSKDNSIVFNKKLDGSGRQKVYLGIKRFLDTDNVEVVDDLNNIKADKRFICDIRGEEINDMYSTSEKADVKFLKYAVRLFLENEINEINEYELILIGEIDLDEKEINDKFIPPLINMFDNKKSVKILEKFFETLNSKINKLNEYKLPFNTGISSNKYVKFLLILQILNKNAAYLSVIFEKKKIHPFEFYSSLKELIAELSVFTDRIDYTAKAKSGKYLIGKYDHNNLSKVFDEFHLLLKELLDDMVMGPEFTITLNKEDSIFSAELPKDIFEKKYRYYILIKPENIDEFKSKYAEFIKVSSKQRLNVLIQRALDGVEMQEVSALEGMPIRDDVVYYKINTYSNEWNNIEKDKSIAVYAEGVEYIELIVMKD
ncbi:type VI secretion system baseplate subunit TssK [Nautilia lithotrophica]